MRTWILAVLIALLPLRGWAADVMAMPSPAPVSQESSMAGMDCHMHDGATDDSASDAPCHACQVCHGVAVEPVGESLSLPAQAHVAPSNFAVAFVSAELARGVEPPIL